MREYDENIRLYTPILQRIIILVAVIVAVPVVLWTITAFVRSYIGPPRLPTFRPIAANEAPQTPVQVAAQTPDPPIATDARAPLLEVKKPAATEPPQAAPTMSAPTMAASTPSASDSPPALPAPTMSVPTTVPAMSAPAIPAPAMTAALPASSPVAEVAAPVVVPPPPFAASRATQRTIAAPAAVTLANVAQPMPRPLPSSGSAMSVPADSTAENQPASASSQHMASNDSAAGDLPAGIPLTGKIPLPLRRPHVAVLAEALTHGAAHVALAAGPVAAGVPLPRARPAAAVPDPTPVDPAYPTYDPSQIH